ncbi:MAG: hypothetical protein ACOX8K_05870 [Lachnospiraceae bacterium]|jgi:hypothetical protein
MDNNKSANTEKITVEVKQAFLSNAISDISSYIQLADTKVSIIMAAVVAIIVGLFACCEAIGDIIALLKPCSWQGVAFIILAVLLAVSTTNVFVFGILTIRSHVSKIGYKSKWFLPQSTKEYSFDAYKEDVLTMNDEDVIVNMAAELYKLNDINRQKQATYKWTLRSFSASLIIFTVICVLFLLSVF